MTTNSLFEKHETFPGFELAGIARTCRGMPVCGDAFAWHVSETAITVVVADGLGHGQPAREAADRAIDAFLEEPGLPADRILRRCHDALTRTRGAAVAVAQVDLARRELGFCGVGNVGVREIPRRGGRGASVPGIVGMRLPAFRVFFSRVEDHDYVLFHTDGINGAFDPMDVAKLAPLEAARTIQQRWGLAHDDASVVCLRFHAREVR
ncbi:Anti-sigma B factor RsbT / Phosphoserine phosphatase RsbX [Labilithrix luteola]|uniref:Anti-sigma B factor RsbT / Phosphoserine phosphatase RsbX n=1 Tax=Labilithrix luteola TaxID=1391654 RepID=A0A0K1Q1P4_9BACT|nr:SpoIIE family protein phosphatase [Labilithrix luteola]AKU99304.1 Anti-sigma B factor RsbT / Phosphoserine phosphatase RsbX [Labilithrix luteola]